MLLPGRKLTLLVNPVRHTIKNVRSTIFRHPRHSPIGPHIQIVLPHERDTVPIIIPPGILNISRLILHQRHQLLARTIKNVVVCKKRMSILLRVVRRKQNVIPRRLNIVVVVITAQLTEIRSVNEGLFSTRDDVGKYERARGCVLDDVGPVRGVRNPLEGGPGDAVATSKVVGKGGEFAFAFSGRRGCGLSGADCESKQEGSEGGADCELVNSVLSALEMFRKGEEDPGGEQIQPTKRAIGH